MYTLYIFLGFPYMPILMFKNNEKKNSEIILPNFWICYRMDLPEQYKSKIKKIKIAVF